MERETLGFLARNEHSRSSPPSLLLCQSATAPDVTVACKSLEALVQGRQSRGWRKAKETMSRVQNTVKISDGNIQVISREAERVAENVQVQSTLDGIH